MVELLNQIKVCEVCLADLPHRPRPVMSAGVRSKIAIIGQAPGRKVHETGVAWADQSGKLLRTWLDVTETQFYNRDLFAIIPMGFCFPGHGQSGDLPPRPECAPLWHPQLFDQMKEIQLTLLIGQYAQKYYLRDRMGRNLTETVKQFRTYLPTVLPLPHPSPRNRFWLRKNPWFETEALPDLQLRVKEILR